jgi:Leucine-rich repeat (LRR) protein
MRRLRDLRSIESLHLKVGQEFSDEAWRTLLTCRSVDRLRLERYQFSPTRPLAGLSAWTQLRSLTVEGGEFSAADAQETACLPNLRQLTLSTVDATDAVLALLVALRRLEVFELTHAGHGRNVTSGGVAFLADLPKLRFLALARLPSIDDDICTHLEKMTQLESLNLDQATVSGASFDRLAGLTRLKSLNLIGTRVDDAAMEQLTRLPQLEELDVGHTRITDAGLAHISALRKLRRLNVAGNNLTDAGVASLAELKQLDELMLAGTAVTDAGLKHLAGLPKLRSLWLGAQANVTPAAVAELKKSLPACSVYQH